MIYALWHGGSSYSPGSIPEDVESFDSVEDATDAFIERYESGYSWQQTFRYVNREHDSVLTPAVGEDATMFLYFDADPSGQYDPYPDRVVNFDGEGNMRVEHC